MDFSIEMEVMSFVTVGVLSLFHIDRRNHNNNRYRLFSLCLILSMGTIGLDIASTAVLRIGPGIPYWINIFLNTLYFITLDMTFSVMAFYCFYIMFEHLPDRCCYRRAAEIIIGFALLLLIFNLANIRGGWIFRISENGYERGPLNKIGFVPLLIEVGMFCVCYMKNREVISHSIRRLVQIIPTLAILIAAAQIAAPNIILTGTLAALADIVLFINFQASRNGRDSLTGLPGRVNFIQEIEARKKQGETLHLIMVYLEKFEDVNKMYGVRQGDTVLFLVAGFLEQNFPGYQVCRFGNTTFLLMGTSTDPEREEDIVRKIRNRFDLPWINQNPQIRVRTSIAHGSTGISCDDANMAVEKLEYALSCIRESGGDAVLCFDSALKKQYDREEYVLELIKKAIRDHGFEVYIQPIYDVESDSFCTGESLLRLKNEEGVFIPPGEFIPLAEKNGLIGEISWQVMESVIRFIASHRELPLERISVNISIRQLLAPDFLEHAKKLRDSYGIPSGLIGLEITERIMAEEPKKVQEVMKEFSGEGVRFYLDDFGIGYSNLAMVMDMPFETVKLDASLIKKLTRGEREKESLRLLVEMLHNSGFCVVAEGIETEEQMHSVRELKVDRIQGFYYAKPMPFTEYADFMMKENSVPKKEK